MIAREWYGTFAGRLTPGHGDWILRRLETYVFHWIGAVPIREVTAVDVLECLQRLQQQNTHETARRVLRYCRQTVRHAVATGRAEFDVLSHARLDDPLLRRIRRWACFDAETIAFRELRVGALYDRIVHAGASDRALGVVDDQPLGHPTKPLEGTAVAAQPRGDGLIKHKLQILMTRETQRHHEAPGAPLSQARRIQQNGAGAEIHLSRFGGCELQGYCGIRLARSGSPWRIRTRTCRYRNISKLLRATTFSCSRVVALQGSGAVASFEMPGFTPNWLQYAENSVAPLRRTPSGSYMTKIH